MIIPVYAKKTSFLSLIPGICLLTCMAVQPVSAQGRKRQATGPLVSTANCYGHYPQGIFRYDGTSTNYKIYVHYALNYGKSQHPELFDKVTAAFIAAMNSVNPSIQYQQVEGEQPYMIIRMYDQRNAAEDRHGLLVNVYGPDAIDASGGHFYPPFNTANMRQWFTYDQGLLYTIDPQEIVDAGTKIGQYLSNGWTCSNPDRP